MPWQTATVFFAVIDLVAAVGLWLAAAWGAVVWLTAAVSMAAVELFFPQVYRRRGSLVVIVEVALLVDLSVPGDPVGPRAPARLTRAVGAAERSPRCPRNPDCASVTTPEER